MPSIVQVEPLTLARALRGPFDYRLTPDLGDVGVGTLLAIPFGRRRALGVVTGLADASEVPDDRLLAPLEALEPSIPAPLVPLALTLADEYCSTPARALALVAPPGTSASGRRGPQPRAVLVAALTDEGAAARAGDVPLTDRQRAIIDRLAAEGPRPAADGNGGLAAVRRLERRGLVRVERRPLALARPAAGPASAPDGGGPPGAPAVAPRPPRPTAEQAAAIAVIGAAIGAPPGDDAGSFLLHGVTGSGKTEVYLAAVAAALERDRGAIVLVPEIALTPQIVARFRARFGDTVAVLHSGLTVAERRDAWLALRRGDARICIGPRSAVFAPVEPLGLLVVDEEHDPSYKNEGDPGYDARRVAELRARAAGAPLVLGSATPRPESVAGTARRLRLDRRVDDRPLPPVELLDMRGARHPLHPRTRDALTDVRARGQKAIVLLNRRGWSNFLSCRECGHAWMCDRCDVTLVLHRRDATLACHHCGRREPVPERCTACGSTAIGRHGAGTERIEHELVASLGAPDFPIVRLDADTTAARGRLDALLARFAAAPAGILLGTQIVAKGHDFPDVALAVVVDADAALRFPDFRAEERTFSLVAQLAGRAGRGTDGARVLVQTLVPDAPAIACAAHHDSDGFLAGELERRRAVGYPPFAHMVRVVCSSPRPGAADAAAAALCEAIDLPGERVLGPAPLFRLRGRERSQLVVRARDRRRAADAVGAAVEVIAGTQAGRRAAISVDVDPR